MELKPNLFNYQETIINETTHLNSQNQEVIDNILQLNIDQMTPLEAMLELKHIQEKIKK